MGSGDRASVSSSEVLLNTVDGVVRRSQVVSSLIIERFVGRVCWVDVPMAVHMIDFSATFGYFTNMRRRALSYFRRRVF